MSTSFKRSTVVVAGATGVIGRWTCLVAAPVGGAIRQPVDDLFAIARGRLVDDALGKVCERMCLQFGAHGLRHVRSCEPNSRLLAAWGFLSRCGGSSLLLDKRFRALTSHAARARSSST